MTNRTRKSAPSRQPLIPGARCPAVRTNKSHDPSVTVTGGSRSYRDGTRTCGMCGQTQVPVRQSYGDHITAWYYEWHNVPTLEES